MTDCSTSTSAGPRVESQHGAADAHAGAGETRSAGNAHGGSDAYGAGKTHGARETHGAGGGARRVLGPGNEPHPLDPLGAAEIEHARRTLADAGVLSASSRIAYLGLDEPSKTEVLAFDDGAAMPGRRVRAFVIDLATEASEEVVVSLTDDAVQTRRPIDPAVDGQVPLLDEEHTLVRRVVKADPGWVEALRRRGVTDLETVYVAALTAGHFDRPGEQGRRIARVLAHLQPTPESLPWAHPIDGLVAYVDLTKETVLEVVDTGPLPIPEESGDYHVPGVFGPYRTSQRPIEITQPEGPSFHLDDNLVTWENWSVRLGYDMREGLILHRLAFDDGGRTRPIIYRASVAEMVVPYGDPSAVRFWQNYFDTGEYQLGRLANSLELGCDCLGEITYFDVTVVNDDGSPRVISNAICMHEEDYGVLWKHTDPANGSVETRRQRRLVISFFVTVGNYDYGFYWYLYLDGTIELEVKATGIVFTGAYDERARRYGSEVAPGLAAPYHQHLFGARLDMTVDGVPNAVDELDVVPLPPGADNPYGSAFTQTATRFRTEGEAQRLADNAVDRVWRVSNPSVHNRFGRPVAYALYPEGKSPLLAGETSSIRRRATFATKHLWVTRYHPEERYPAGDLVNQHPGGAGLPTYAQANREIDGQDVVLWHTFGLTHFPRPEDWPIMPVDTCGFTLKPVGFFDRNPTVDVPPTSSRCACTDHGACHC
ncbi:primary-amine oxidase [Phytoactinopolyspora halotolerans]|uniref:Amine oxidase n=1 Tax=Phytoactinopolyspora halotolerans TaxID=1981512 RepID=A0A6L9S427_9ACTN|nr:primary-amine oxidase [Phytoactinopolyspora halotolerans]NEE00205.1 primary-amine oxidase [Phytoactinopolyspora halotolerans]